MSPTIYGTLGQTRSCPLCSLLLIYARFHTQRSVGSCQLFLLLDGVESILHVVWWWQSKQDLSLWILNGLLGVEALPIETERGFVFAPLGWRLHILYHSKRNIAVTSTWLSKVSAQCFTVTIRTFFPSEPYSFINGCSREKLLDFFFFRPLSFLAIV